MIACKEYDSQPMFLKKVKDYLDRADTLEAQWKEQQDAARRPKPTSEALDLSRARFLLMQALELDEAGGIDEPLQQYGI